MLDNDAVKPVGAYWSHSSGEIVVGMSDGTTESLGTLSNEFFDQAYEAVKASGNYGNHTADWYVSLSDVDWNIKADDPREGGDQSDDGGDSESDGDQSDESQGDESQESEGDDAQSDDPPEFDHDTRDKQADGQDCGNPLAQSIWELIEPLVDLKDQAAAYNVADYSLQVAQHFAKNNSGGGGSSGTQSGLILKFEKGKVGKVDGVTHHMFPKILAAVQRGVHVYLPGPPGTGKSHMVAQIAEALGIDFSVMSLSPQNTESKIVGYMDANGNYVRTGWRDRYEHGGAMLLDEMDNGNGSIMAVTNGGLANDRMGFPDGVVARHPDFICIGTANTLGTGPTAEFAGRQKIDPATLNRFVKFYIDTDEVMEDHIVNSMITETTGQAWLKKVRHVRKAVDDLKIKHFVTMRDSINGARLIAPGAGKFTQLEALEVTVLASLTDDQRSKIKAWRG